MKDKEIEIAQQIVIDASSGILGRIASYAAKQALLGKKVIIVNCDGALITGKRRFTISEYLSKRRRGGSSLNGPHFPKYPYRLMKRTIRGMLSYQQQRGLNAYKRIICYNDIPEEYVSAQKISTMQNISTKTINLQELSREM